MRPVQNLSPVSYTHLDVYKRQIISPSEAKPGDIIFFTGTYDSPGPVSHVGIYVGDGMMLHCGSPIQYAVSYTHLTDAHRTQQPP